MRGPAPNGIEAFRSTRREASVSCSSAEIAAWFQRDGRKSAASSAASASTAPGRVRQTTKLPAGIAMPSSVVARLFSMKNIGSLSEILCLRHTMANERSQYAYPQDEEGGGRHHTGVDQA